MAKTKTKELDFDRDYQNISGGMLVTTIHKGSGTPHVTFVPGQYYIEELDEDGEGTGEFKFASTIEARQYQVALAKRNIKAAKKAKRAKKTTEEE